ncbi:MAG: hypothetical protein AAF989_15525 [Planctomycetota bacterium]
MTFPRGLESDEILHADVESRREAGMAPTVLTFKVGDFSGHDDQEVRIIQNSYPGHLPDTDPGLALQRHFGWTSSSFAANATAHAASG